MSETMAFDQKDIVLTLPDMQVFQSYIEALKEGYYRGTDKPASAKEIAEFQEAPGAHIASLNEQKIGTFKTPDGSEFSYAPYETLWLSAGKTFIGSVSFRHELTELLKYYGGHVGYGIRPKYQGQGLGTLALKLTRQRAHEMGIDKLLLTCSPDNPASEKVILNNGGEFIDISTQTYGFCEATKRFWVPTAMKD